MTIEAPPQIPATASVEDVAARDETVMQMLRELTNKGIAFTAAADAAVASASKAAAAAAAAAGADGEEEDAACWTIMGASKARALRTALRTRLPPYMIPAAMVCAVPGVGKMPMTANGKVDRAALPAPASLRRLGRLVCRKSTSRTLNPEP